ncbi:hypothetical protein ACNKU7_08405 [Microbulbifer sp. SA54]|uniref:hypothetical protein n=1 Tax=Microbulbifer sp. SA54 TaxID=3401577 RepID=UPI003AAFE5B9
MIKLDLYYSRFWGYAQKIRKSVLIGKSFWAPDTGGSDVDPSNLIEKDRVSVFLARYRKLLYVDNSDESSTLQVARWYNSNFLATSEVGVVIVKYAKSLRKVTTSLDKLGIPYLAINSFTELDLKNVSHIFYVFNSASNSLLMVNRTPLHVFLGHGQSEKGACEHPMLRMYDYIGVAGPRAKEKLVLSSILSQSDVASRCIQIGMPYMPRRERDGRPGSLIYAPTWEGGMPEQEYSSLPFGKTQQYFLDLVEKNDIQVVVIRPHPSTAIKNRNYVVYLNDLIMALYNRFGDDGIAIEVELQSGSNIARRFQSSKLTKRLPASIIIREVNVLNLAEYEFVLADISAVATEAAALGLKLHVLVAQLSDLQVARNRYKDVIYVGLESSEDLSWPSMTKFKISDVNTPEVGYEHESWEKLQPDILFREVVLEMTRRESNLK